MMATVPHVTSGLGLRKFQADGFLLTRVYNPDVVIGTESWLKEDISNAEVFGAIFTTFRRGRSARGGGIFICVKNIIVFTELWVDDDFEMIAVEVKGMDK